MDFELITLSGPSANSRVVVAPERGALVSSFCVAERELLYLDQSKFPSYCKIY